MTYYTVKKGDCLFSISVQFNIPKWQTIWDAPENEALRDARSLPNCLAVGDKLFIPNCAAPHELEPEAEIVLTTGVTPEQVVRIRLLKSSGDPLKSQTIELVTDEFGPVMTKQTDGSGILEVSLPLSVKTFWVAIPAEQGTRLVPFEIGNLPPIEEAEGIQKRLHNLNSPLAQLDGDSGLAAFAAEKQMDLEQAQSFLKENQ